MAGVVGMGGWERDRDHWQGLWVWEAGMGKVGWWVVGEGDWDRER